MILKKFDYISPEITLFYRGDDRHSSIPSAIISIVCLILILAMTIFVSLDFLLKKNPTAFYYHNYKNDLGIYFLNSSQFFHFISFDINTDTKKIDLKNFIIIGVTVLDSTYIINNNPTEFDHYIYEECDKNDAGDLYSYMDDDVKLYYNNGFCIKKFYNSKTKTIINTKNKDFIYPYLQHGAKRSDNIPYGIYIQKCKNYSFYNEDNCNSLETIEEYFESLDSYSILFADSVVNIGDYKKPLNFIFPKVSNSFNSISYTANHLNFNPLEITTHSGIIFDINSNIESYIYDYTEKLVIKDSENDIHGSFHFWLQNQVECYDRTYKKIQDISGSIDGLVEIMMLLIECFNSFIFHDYKILSDFNNEIEKAVERVKSSKNLDKILSNSFNANQSFRDYNKNLVTNSLNSNKKKNSSQDLKKNIKNSKVYNKNTIQTYSSNIPTSNNDKKSFIEKKNSLIKHSTKLEKKWKKIKWTQLFCRFRQSCLMSKYVNFIQNKREDIISEEMIIKYYLAIKKIKDFLISNYDIFDTNNNINISIENNNNKKGDIEILKEEDIESINLEDFESSYRKNKKIKRKNTKSNNFNL